jgi:hypothetical protein
LSIFPVTPLFVSADMDLLSAISSEWGTINFLAKDASSALKNQALLTAPPGTILVLDAQVPQTAASPPDRQEKAAMGLLRDLRKNGINIPTLVITLLSVGTSDLYDYCSPENNAIALPLQHFNRQTAAAFIHMLEPRRTLAQPTWDVIEVEVKHDSAKCFLGSRGGTTMIEWSHAPSRNRMAEKLAFEYTNPNFKPGWARTIHMHGALLFNDLVISTLGRGFFAHLELAAGGLEKLAFRFRVDDTTLYSAPFEAAVRESGQPLSGDDDDFNQHPFVLVNAPITRRMKGITLRTAPAAAVPHPARLLFIRSQVCENPAGATDSDVVEVRETDRNDGHTRVKQLEFRKLDNINRELKCLQTLKADNPAIFSMEELDLSQHCSSRSAEKVLRQTLSESHFDVVHFAGHSITTKNSLTLLILPSNRLGEADSMAVHAFAEGVAAANARLVYLSSCQGSSANTVASLGQRGVPHVLGFRWNVDDERAAEFARLFYSDLFGPESAMISSAFRAACRGVYKPEQVEASSPIWASPVLASLSDNWMAQRIL